MSDKKTIDPAATPQPPPTGDGETVINHVVKDLVARSAMGCRKYGTVLKTHNGRDALWDAYQECLDQAMYLRQAILERKAARPVCHSGFHTGGFIDQDAFDPAQMLRPGERLYKWPAMEKMGGFHMAPAALNVTVHIDCEEFHAEMDKVTEGQAMVPGLDHAPPRWRQFLQETIQDPVEIMQVQEFAGLCMTTAMQFGKALLISGPGPRGKSIFTNILAAMTGDNCSHVALGDLDRETCRYELSGKLLNISDVRYIREIESAYFKAILSGDPVSARSADNKFYVMTPCVKFILVTNAGPSPYLTGLAMENAGMFRRLLHIRFRTEFHGPARNPDLKAKLEKELPGIQTWAIHGFRRLMVQGGFTGHVCRRRPKRIDNAQ